MVGEILSTEPEVLPGDIALIHLPRLRSLIIDDVPESFVQVLMTRVATEGYRFLSIEPAFPDHLEPCFPAFKSLLEKKGVAYTKTVGEDAEVFNVSAAGDETSELLSLTFPTDPDLCMETLRKVMQVITQGSPSTAIQLYVGKLEESPIYGSDSDYGSPYRELVLNGAVLASCPSLEVLWVGPEVNMDAALEYLAEAQMDESGRWSWPCPRLSEVWVREWTGDSEGLLALAKARWAVPSTLPVLEDLPRKKLRWFQAPK